MNTCRTFSPCYLLTLTRAGHSVHVIYLHEHVQDIQSMLFTYMNTCRTFSPWFLLTWTRAGHSVHVIYLHEHMQDIQSMLFTYTIHIKEKGNLYFCDNKIFRLYTGCPRRNVPDFGRVFLMSKYTDITQNTYIQSWTVTEIMAREVWNFDRCYTLIAYQIHIKTGRNMWFL